MISDTLSSTEGVSIFAIIALISFVLLFVGVVIWIFKADKKYLKKMKNLPLESENKSINNSGQSNETS
jgi:cbb3-type cytochrome oxidase subunit 3